MVKGGILNIKVLAITLGIMTFCFGILLVRNQNNSETTVIPYKDYISINAGHDNFLALTSDGSIESWGDNRWGKSDAPQNNDYIAVAAGYDYSLALRKDGSIVQWGYDDYGKMKAPEGNHYIAIAAGYNSSLALTKDGSILQWGYGDSIKAEPPSGEDFVHIDAGYSDYYALRKDGSLYTWSNTDKPRRLVGNFIDIAAGAHHCLALRKDGSIVGFGNNEYGQASPPAGNRFIAIAAGDHHSLALKSDGSIVGWGKNFRGEIPCSNRTQFVSCAAGDFYSIALKSDGSIVEWGEKSVMMPPIKFQPNLEETAKKTDRDVEGIPKISNISSDFPFPYPREILLTLKKTRLDLCLVYIPSGQFMMGSNMSTIDKITAKYTQFETNYPDEWPERKIRITKGFYIGKYKITCEQFCTFLNSIEEPREYINLNEYSRVNLVNDSYVSKQGCENCAISGIPWEGAEAFCSWLSNVTGFPIRLPTEAEWEYTARGQEGRTYPWGDDKSVEYRLITAYHYKEYPYKWSCPSVTAFPGDITPNGVVGMAGRGKEWCSDYYLNHYLKNDLIDPKGPTKEYLQSHDNFYLKDPLHVFRSDGPYTICRGGGNSASITDGANSDYGFRVVMELPKYIDKR